jgi:predicted acetyltransferase
MEQGHWDFSPDWWYWLMHKNYSGAYTKWEWHGFKSGLRVHFDEKKSNVKTVGPRREKQLATMLLKQQVVETERKKIEELNKEEVARAADRNVDLVYGKYKDLFSDMQSSITEGLIYCMTKSKGKMAGSVKELTDRNEVITSNIAYLRKTGIGYELENVKREKGFAQAKKDMEELVKKVVSLARLARAYY